MAESFATPNDVPAWLLGPVAVFLSFFFVFCILLIHIALIVGLDKFEPMLSAPRAIADAFSAALGAERAGDTSSKGVVTGNMATGKRRRNKSAKRRSTATWVHCLMGSEALEDETKHENGSPYALNDTVWISPPCAADVESQHASEHFIGDIASVPVNEGPSPGRAADEVYELADCLWCTPCSNLI